jgi:hypothetical protein
MSFRDEAGLYRRDGSPRGAEFGGAPIYVDPAVSLAAQNAWAADDVTATTTTTQWNPYLGAAVLTVLGTAQGAPVNLSQLGNRKAVPYGGNGYYGGTVVTPGASRTYAWIGRMAADPGGLFGLSNGTINSDDNAFQFSNALTARRPGVVDTNLAKVAAWQGVVIITATAGGCSIYLNSGTAGAVSAAVSAGTSGTLFTLGGLDNTGLGIFQMTGHIARAAMWNRILSAGEIASAMQTWCNRYGQTYTP